MHWMSIGRKALLPAAGLAAALSLLALSPAAASKMRAGHMAHQPVNVSISFNRQTPAGGMSEDEMAEAQTDGRVLLYKLAQEECDVLLRVIAETCRLTHLNVSSQMQNYGNQNQPMLYINGSATFAITLKDDDDGAEDEDDDQE